MPDAGHVGGGADALRAEALRTRPSGSTACMPASWSTLKARLTPRSTTKQHFREQAVGSMVQEDGRLDLRVLRSFRSHSRRLLRSRRRSSAWRDDEGMALGRRPLGLILCLPSVRALRAVTAYFMEERTGAG